MTTQPNVPAPAGGHGERAALTDQQLAAWERAAEAATAGPWERENGSMHPGRPLMRRMVYCDEGMRVDQSIANADFIATARTALPLLLAEVRALRAAMVREAASLDDAAYEVAGELSARVMRGAATRLATAAREVGE